MSFSYAARAGICAVYGIISFCPTQMKFGSSRSFASTIASTLVPYAWAIWATVSPDWTVWVVGSRVGAAVASVGVGGAMVAVAVGGVIGVSDITMGVVVGLEGNVDVDCTSMAGIAEVAVDSIIGSPASRAHPAMPVPIAMQNSSEISRLCRNKR